MHRSPLSVLVICAAVAACSSQDAIGATEFLSQDPTLAARLEQDRPAARLPLPDACSAYARTAQSVAENPTEAKALTRRAYDAEALGRTDEARALLRRASELDGTNKSIAYHLGRTSEALGARTEALTAYCRYLTLAPAAAESTDARQRVARLAQPGTLAMTRSVTDTAVTGRGAPAATATRATRVRRPVAPRTVAPRAVAGTAVAGTAAVARATVARSAPVAPSERGARSASVAAGPSNDAPAPRVQATDAADTAASVVAGGDVVATPAGGPIAPVEQPSTAARTESRGPSRAQRAGIGAATGALIGAISGRGVKGAAIGAAAGGLIGTAVGGGYRPVGRGIVPVGRGIRP
jgi:hypothetical protein